MPRDEFGDEGHRIDCPECDWESREFDDIRGELATKVDAEMHYVEDHGGRIPDDAPFGEYQCPECFDTHGLHRTVSCSECGFIPDEVRA